MHDYFSHFIEASSSREGKSSCFLISAATAACSHTSCRHFLEIFIFRTALFLHCRGKSHPIESEVFLRCGKYSSSLAQPRRMRDITLSKQFSPLPMTKNHKFHYIFISIKKKPLISTISRISRTALLTERAHTSYEWDHTLATKTPPAPRPRLI